MPISQQGLAYNTYGAAHLFESDVPPLVLIHGIGLNQHIWDAFIPVLSKEFGVITYDLAGHGRSALPEKKPDLDLLARQLLALLDELSIERCSLIGFSLGGMLNRRFAMDYPHRVNALVIMNSPHERTPEAQRLVEERANQSDDGPAATLDATLERWFTVDFLEQSPVVDDVKAWVLSNNRQNFAYFRQLLATGVTELIRPQPAISVPTLVMTCEQDVGSTPAMTEAIAAEMSNAGVVVVPSLKHLGLLEQPETFINKMLLFLNNASAAHPQQ